MKKLMISVLLVVVLLALVSMFADNYNLYVRACGHVVKMYQLGYLDKLEGKPFGYSIQNIINLKSNKPADAAAMKVLIAGYTDGYNLPKGVDFSNYEKRYFNKCLELFLLSQ